MFVGVGFNWNSCHHFEKTAELLSSGREAFEQSRKRVTFFVIDIPNDLLSRLVGALAPTFGVFDPQGLHLVDRSEPLACEWLGLDIRIEPKNYSPTDEHSIRHHALGRLITR